MSDFDSIKMKLIDEIEKSLVKIIDDPMALKPIHVVWENDDKVVTMEFSHITDDGNEVYIVSETFKHPMKNVYITFKY